MRAAAGLVFAACAAPAFAGALQDCQRDADVVHCLERAKDAATEHMLGRFLDLRAAVTAAGGARADTAADALKQSQRAFERYLAEHCHGLAAFVTQGAAAALACETDLLRQRAAALEAIQPGT